MDGYGRQPNPSNCGAPEAAPVFELLMIASEWRCDEADMAVTVVWMDTPLLCFGFVNDSFLEFGKGSANISYFAPSSIITKCPVFGHGSGLCWAGCCRCKLLQLSIIYPEESLRTSADCTSGDCT